MTQLAQFLKEWEPKSETRTLPEFLEYLDYFEQAGGVICLEDDVPGDAVQLMTVHGAKGLEFPHVFLLRVNHGAFPARERSPLFEFPVKLMKEELPAGQFHIQEERRLFYVALTRAERKLTITTLTEKKGKVPTFIEDILMDPAVKRRDVLQIAPRCGHEKKKRDANGANSGASYSFPVAAAAHIFEDCGLGGDISSSSGGAAEAEFFAGGQLPEMPAAVCVRLLVVAERGAARDVELWQRDAYDDQALRRADAERREAAV